MIKKLLPTQRCQLDLELENRVSVFNIRLPYTAKQARPFNAYEYNEQAIMYLRHHMIPSVSTYSLTIIDWPCRRERTTDYFISGLLNYC